RVERFLYVEVQLLPLRQKPVELMLAQHRAQRGLRELAGGAEKIDHLYHGFLRIDHTEVNDGVHFHRYVVAGDHVLRRHVQHHDAQIHFHHLLHEGNQEEQSRSFHRPEAPQLKHHAALVFAQDADRPHHHQHDDDDHTHAKSGHHD